MTTLNIQGQTVNVDDSFMKLSPEDQNTTVQDIARQMGIAPAAAGPPPSGQDVSVISAAGHLPVVGPYAAPAAAWLRSKARGGTPAENLAQIQSDISDYERRKPIQSALGGAVIGTLPYLVAGEFAGPARALGMAGRAREAIPLAAGTGALIGGMDASARGQSPGWGMAEGATTNGPVGPTGVADKPTGRGTPC